MKRFLLANDQNLSEFEGLSRETICERMRDKAKLYGKEYVIWPY